MSHHCCDDPSPDLSRDITVHLDGIIIHDGRFHYHEGLRFETGHYLLKDYEESEKRRKETAQRVAYKKLLDAFARRYSQIQVAGGEWRDRDLAHLQNATKLVLECASVNDGGKAP